MASGDLSLTSNSSQDSSHEFNFERPRKPSNDSIKDLESAKQQYDQAIIELNSLRVQQNDSKLRMEHIMEQLEFYREQYMAAMNQVEQSAQEGTSLRTKYTDLSNENVRLQQRNHHLEKKLSRFVESMKDNSVKDNGNSQACAFVEQYNDLKKKYDLVRVEYDKLNAEMEKCKKLCSDLSRDRNSLALEKDDLKQQLSNAFEQLKTSLREKSAYREARDKLIEQHDTDIKEMTQLMQSRAEELRRVTGQRNAAEQELRTILAERKGVLEENQKLSDDLSAAKEKLEKYYKDDKKLTYENDNLKREIESVLRYKDDLAKECSVLREKVESKDLLKSRDSSWSKDISSVDGKGLSDQHALDLETANEEIEKLRKSLERAMAEIEKATLDTEVSKCRRDWAITEREKIVQERDSVKGLCDKLRKERDTAISDLLAAIRDSEKIKKQKDEACREVERIRESFESQLGNSRRNIRWSYNPYDLELLQKNDSEMIELDVSGIGVDDIGIVLEGGRDDSQNRVDSGVVVVSVSPDSIAYGKLRPNDCILQVNNLDCTSISKRVVLETIRTSGGRCIVIVKRPKVNKPHMYAVNLNMNSNNRNHGLTLETGVFISKIMPGSLAAKEEDLSAGDRVLSVNSKTMEGVKTAKDAMSYLDDNRSDALTIIGLKQVAQSFDTPISNRTKHNRMINICTQTDERYSSEFDTNRNFIAGSSKSTSKISEMINKFKGKMNIHGHSNQKGSTVSESDSLCQENDAIAVLDLVLNNENSSGKSKDNLFKRSKRSKKDSSKDVNKNLGTWPRANIMNAGRDDHQTITQRKKERPPLTLFPGPVTLGDEIDKPNLSKRDPPTAARSSSVATNSNRNSNPIPFHIVYPSSNRYSAVIDHEPMLLEHQNTKPVPVPNLSNTLGRNQNIIDTVHPYRHHHPNRLSLNLTQAAEPFSACFYNPNNRSKTIDNATKPFQQTSLEFSMKNSNESVLSAKSPVTSLDFKPRSMQSPQDLISLKSQTSADSVLSPKSPPSMEFSIRSYPKESMEYGFPYKRNVGKYPSDSDSIGMDIIPTSNSVHTNTLLAYSSHPRALTSTNRVPPRVFGQTSHLHPHHPHSIRQTSPLTLLQSHDQIALRDRTELEYGMHSQMSSMDMDSYGQRGTNKKKTARERDSVYSIEFGTFPRSKENQRILIPSNPSVIKGSGVKNSTGSIEHGSERGSPMPPAFQVEVLSRVNDKRNSMPNYCFGQKPNWEPGDLRRVTIDKLDKQLGITICCNNNGGGIFVSTVTENSIASQAGLQIGDQLLEFCGINMRSATYDVAAKFLRQCGNSITMLVQYNPDKYDGNIIHASEDDSVSRSGSPTPRNSPRPTRSLLMTNEPNVGKQSSPQIPQLSLLPHQMKKQKFADSLENQSESSLPDSTSDIFEADPRKITMNTKNKSTNLGISLLGGNAVGIYVHDVQKNSLAESAGMRKGDQILEYNGADLRRVTAEHAANEISKPAEKVTVIVQYNLKKFNKIKDEAGDSLYIRVGFDRTGDLGEGELRFVKDDVLYVDTTIFRGVFGQWRAWKLDEYGHRLECGIIPSQLKVEEELRLLGDVTDGDSTTRRGSTSARRSFFRRKKHPRSSSRDSKELASFSNTQLSWFSDSGMLSEEGTIPSYQRVERLDYSVCRPVLILGPLSECVADKMIKNDFPQQFERCLMTKMNCSQDAMEKGLQNNILIDYRKRDSIYECTTVQAIRDICDKNRHCIIDVCISAVERLHRLQIFPIVLLLHFKSAKQIKEIQEKDSRYPTEKITLKAAKEMYEHALKLESDYRHYISEVIYGANITHLSTQIKAAVDKEQTKVLWVPVSSQ
ncbi:disks large homolog 5 isoform X2 [Bradysia coprophila]|uniref:disks large homolog 5 isoform X2 n=1 Tax=Bradysia coprophila TaxID=38358 RepID=UPI00187D98E8|nr:disks large homolog 5 isoform X2 [Bradysia coprophila]